MPPLHTVELDHYRKRKREREGGDASKK